MRNSFRVDSLFSKLSAAGPLVDPVIGQAEAKKREAAEAEAKQETETREAGRRKALEDSANQVATAAPAKVTEDRTAPKKGTRRRGK